MDPMIDDQRIDAALRRFLAADADALAEAAMGQFEMAARVQTRVRGPRPERRLVLLLAATLLIASLAATAIAVGTGLIHLPWQSDLMPAFAQSCGYEPPATVVLDYGQSSNGSQGGQSVELTLDTSGRLISRASGLYSSLTIRRLTARGISLLIDEVRKGPIAPGCRAIATEGASDFTVALRLAGGIQGVRWGANAGTQSVHPASATEAARALTLQTALDHIEQWMPADGWLDATARTYLPDRWEVRIFREPSSNGLPAGPDPSPIRMPDGSSLSSFGTANPTYGQTERCGLVSTSFVTELTHLLAEAGVPRSETEAPAGLALMMGPWTMTEASTDTTVSVQIMGLLPHETDCLTQFAAYVDLPSPSTSPDPLDGVGPCDLLPKINVNITAPGDQGNVQFYLRNVGGASFRDCGYFQGLHGLPSAHAVLSLRMKGTSGAEARQIALALFGTTGRMDEELAGHPVYLNGCHGAEVPCTPAIAVSADPYFIVIGAIAPGPGDRATLEALARSVLDHLTMITTIGSEP